MTILTWVDKHIEKLYNSIYNKLVTSRIKKLSKLAKKEMILNQ